MTENIVNIDEIDKKIIRQLDKDCRQSNNTVAKKTGLYKNTVNYRIKKLEQKKIITAYRTLVDFSALGYSLLRVHIDLYEYDEKECLELKKYLSMEKNASFVAQTIGDWDLVVDYHVKKIPEFYVQWFAVLNKYRALIKQYNICIVAKEVFFERKYLLKDMHSHHKNFEIKTMQWQTGIFQDKDIDAIDYKMIGLLLNNAKCQVQLLAKKTGLSSMTVIYRMKQLLAKKVIIAWRTELNLAAFGYNHYRINLELEDTQIINQLQNYCQIQPNIVSYTQAIGHNVDFEFDIEVKGFDTFLQIIDDIKQKFPHSIRDFEYFRFIGKIYNEEVKFL